MNRTVALCTIVSATAAWVAISLSAPWALSDRNDFLREFVGADLLGLLGVIVTITLASAANLHFELNRLEEAAQRIGFPKSRLALCRSAGWLIGLLLIAIALVVAKPWMGCSDVTTSFVNGAALLIVLFNILVLIDLTQMAFGVKPDLPS